MSSWTVAFLVIAVISALFSFTGIGAVVPVITRGVFAVFLMLFLISVLLQTSRAKKAKQNIEQSSYIE